MIDTPPLGLTKQAHASLSLLPPEGGFFIKKQQNTSSNEEGVK